jgi:beta-glucanase (GH16 family)
MDSMKILARVLFGVLLAAGVGCSSESSAPADPSTTHTTGTEPLPEGSSPIGPADMPESGAMAVDETSSTDASTAVDSSSSTGDSSALSDGADRPGWQLVWSDEFNAAAGTKPDPTKWVYDLGGGGWGVAQLQVYTSNAENASHDGNGNLVITAIKDDMGGFTSARLKTEGKFEQAYGRFEVRAKLPGGKGLWPAFWTLGNDFTKNGWPNCGEIDIMENRAIEPSINHGSLHGPGYSGTKPLTAQYTLPNGAQFPDDFHTFAVEWELNVVRFYVDDTLYQTRTPMDLMAPQRWVYDHPHFILLNVAVGGRFPGNPDDTTMFPQTMVVDYVRVYSRPK